MTVIGLYTDSAIVGGAERSLLNLAVAHRGPANLVILSTHQAVLDEAARLGLSRTHRVHASSSWIGSVLDHRRQFREAGLDLLQVTLANPFTSRPAIIGGRLAGIPTVAVEQLVLPSRRRRGRILKRLTSRLQAHTVAVGAKTAADLSRFFGLRSGTITVVHNGVADLGFEPPRGDGPVVVGCAARLEDQKGVDILLQAMAQVPDVQLVLIGDGERRADLERQADALGLTHRVEFRGWLVDARAAIAAFDVFALASRDEAFPLTIVEAMLSGTPVVATDVGSVAEAVLDGETGLLVPSGDVEALAAAIRRMVAEPELRKRLAAAARDHAVQHFTDTAMADGYQRVWTSVLR